MGSVFSSEPEQPIVVRPVEIKEPKIYGNDLIRQLPDGWITAGGKESLSIITTPGRIWHWWSDWAPRNSPCFYFAMIRLSQQAWFPKDGTFGSEHVKESRLKALMQAYGPPEIVRDPDNYCHDPASCMAGKAYFYDYNFTKVDQEHRVIQHYDLKEQREICGFAFLNAMFMYYPVGKNYVEAEGPNKPSLMFAIPKTVFMFVRANGKIMEYEDMGIDNRKCFLKWDIHKENMDKCRFFPIYVMARKKKVEKWKDGGEYAEKCLLQFGRLFTESWPDKYNVEVWIQFSYVLDKVRMVQAVVGMTQSDHGHEGIFRSPQFTESRIDPSKSEIQETSDLILQPDDPEKEVLSGILAHGAFGVTMPPKHQFYQVCGQFYGFDQQNEGQGVKMDRPKF